jgi:AFG3 family protein
MIRLLGKRPWANHKDDMDKWLDDNSPERSAPPPLERPEDVGEPAPEGAVAVRTLDRDARL